MYYFAVDLVAYGRRDFHLAAAVALRHPQHSAREIAEVVREVGVVALDETLVAEVDIEAVDDLAHLEIAQHVSAVLLFVLHRVGNVARAF